MVHGNGTHLNGHTLECDSDHPIIDVVASTPTPRWSNELAPLTHSMSWSDTLGVSHSLTIRANTMAELTEVLGPIMTGIKQSKAKAQAQPAPETATMQPDRDIPPCPIHGTPMERRVNKRTQGIYFSHKVPGGDLCFGREKKA